MHVTYLTIEDIESGLFQTQVLDTLKEILNQRPDIQFEVLIVNRPWHISSHLKQKRSLEKTLNKSITLRYVPLLPPLRDALKWFLYSAMVTEWLSFLYRLLIDEKTDLLHCRSYWPAQAAIKSRRGPVIFDMRSLWTLENVSIGNLTENSKSHQYWLNLERECLEGACVSTGVSKAMVVYAEGIAPKKPIELIPISVDTAKFKFDMSRRLIHRDFLSWQDKIVLVYSGSFGMSDINQNALSSLIRSLMSSDEIRLLFLTMETEAKVDTLISGTAVAADRFRVIHPTNDDIAGWLSAADIGIHALPPQLDSATRLGTKVVEYWATGLPVIVNENVGAAADFIREFDLGAILDTIPASDPALVVKLVQSLSKKDRQVQIDFALQHFSTTSVAKKYLKAYACCNEKKIHG